VVYVVNGGCCRSNQASVADEEGLKENNWCSASLINHIISFIWEESGENLLLDIAE